MFVLSNATIVFGFFFVNLMIKSESLNKLLELSLKRVVLKIIGLQNFKLFKTYLHFKSGKLRD